MTVEKAPAQPRRNARLVRWGVLSAVLVGLTVLAVLHQQMSIGKPVGVDALCPFGGLETLGTLVTGGFLIKRVALSSVLLLGATIVTALVFRRAFCGRICALGYLQELAGGLGRRLFGARRALPESLDRPARLLKYIVLAVVLALSWTTASLVIRPYDPWAAYNHIASAELLTEFGIGFAVLMVSLAGSIVYDRFFCKYACPMGAFLGLISKVSLFRVRRSAETCIDCGACDRACPVNVTVSTVDSVTSAECIDCGECVAACPVKDTLAVATRSGRRLSPVWSAVLPVALFAALVAGATAAGAFAWTLPTLADTIDQSADGAPGTPRFDTTLIKGNTTLAEIADAAGVPPEVFTRVYGVPVVEQVRPLKELKDLYGCTPREIRAFVDAYAADPATAESWTPGAYHDDEEH